MHTQPTPIAFSGKIPEFYDSFLGPMFFEPYAIDMANRIGTFTVSDMLELASGTGRLTKMLPAVVKKGANIVASDINPAMVNYGKAHVTEGNIQWVEVDAVTLPFKDNSFDVVAVQFGVMFYSDRVKAFKEAFRVLKPGGVFIFNCWDEIKNNPIAFITNETLKQFFPVDTPAFYSVPFSYYDENIIKRDLQEAGFNNPKIELVELTGYSKSAANAAKGLVRGTPTVTAIEERDVDKVDEIIDSLEKKISVHFGLDALQVPLRARVVTALKK